MQTAAGTSTTWSSFSRQPASWLPLRRALADRFPAHIDGARFAPFVHRSSTDREAQYALTDACGSSTAKASGLPTDSSVSRRVSRRPLPGLRATPLAGGAMAIGVIQAPGRPWVARGASGGGQLVS